MPGDRRELYCNTCRKRTPFERFGNLRSCSECGEAHAPDAHGKDVGHRAAAGAIAGLAGVGSLSLLTVCKARNVRLRKALLRLLNASVAGSEGDKFRAQQHAREVLDEQPPRGIQ